MFKTCLKKWVFLLFVLFFSLFMELKHQLGFFLIIFYFFLTYSLLSFAWLALEYFVTDICFTRKVIGRAEELDKLEIELNINNKSFLPVFDLFLMDNLTCAEPEERLRKELVTYLPLKSSSKINYKCTCYKRGRYMLGPVTVYFFDPLGIFYLKKVFEIYSEVHVYPRTFRIRKFPDLIKGVLPWFGIDSSRSSGDEDEFFAIREYKSGDPIKRIHWLSSARKNKLIVKQFQRQSFYSATIVFNLRKDDNFGEGRESIAEYTIKLAASVAKYLLEKDISVEIIAHTHEPVHMHSNKGQEHFEAIMKFLASAQVQSMVTLGEIFEESYLHISGDSNLIVIMLDRDWEYLPAIIPMEKRNITLVPLILVSSTFLYALEKHEIVKDVRTKLSEAYNISPILISQGDNLEEVFFKGVK